MKRERIGRVRREREGYKQEADGIQQVTSDLSTPRSPPASFPARPQPRARPRFRQRAAQWPLQDWRSLPAEKKQRSEIKPQGNFLFRGFHIPLAPHLAFPFIRRDFPTAKRAKSGKTGGNAPRRKMRARVITPRENQSNPNTLREGSAMDVATREQINSFEGIAATSRPTVCASRCVRRV